jgi:hypothetical protein
VTRAREEREAAGEEDEGRDERDDQQLGLTGR